MSGCLPSDTTQRFFAILQRHLLLLSSPRLTQLVAWRLKRERLCGQQPSNYLQALLTLLQTARYGHMVHAGIADRVKPTPPSVFADVNLELFLVDMLIDGE